MAEASWCGQCGLKLSPGMPRTTWTGHWHKPVSERVLDAAATVWAVLRPWEDEEPDRLDEARERFIELMGQAGITEQAVWHYLRETVPNPTTATHEGLCRTCGGSRRVPRGGDNPAGPGGQAVTRTGFMPCPDCATHEGACRTCGGSREVTRNGCPESIWDGPYKMRCSLGGDGTVCARHGEFDKERTRCPDCATHEGEGDA